MRPNGALDHMAANTVSYSKLHHIIPMDRRKKCAVTHTLSRRRDVLRVLSFISLDDEFDNR